MKKHVFIAALLVISIVACKNENDSNTNTSPVPIANPNDGSSHQNPVYPDSVQPNLLTDSGTNGKK